MPAAESSTSMQEKYATTRAAARVPLGTFRSCRSVSPRVPRDGCRGSARAALQRLWLASDGAETSYMRTERQLEKNDEATTTRWVSDPFRRSASGKRETVRAYVRVCVNVCVSAYACVRVRTDAYMCIRV